MPPKLGTIVGSDGVAPGSITPEINVIGPGYVAMLDIPVLQGREFTTSDRNGVPVSPTVRRRLPHRPTAAFGVRVVVPSR
jgi:hypothetical protein